jgi:pyridoxal phosphate enzyme (YggS family)
VSSADAQRALDVADRVARAARDAGRDPASVRLLLATKTIPAERVLPVVAAGFVLLGENRVQEVVSKAADLADTGAQVHFIGHLQSNKVNQLLPHTACLQTLDSLDLAQRLDRRLEALERTLEVMVQVNVSGEASKAGVPPEAALDLLAAVAPLPRLRPVGWMTIGLRSDDRGAVRAGYRHLAELRDQAVADAVPGADTALELSMGMSGDYGDAIAEGATMVRVGSAVFGERPRP